MTQLVLNSNRSAAFGAAYMVGAGLLFAIVNTLTQSGTMQFGAASTTFAFWQYVIALLFSLPWMLARMRNALSTKRLPMQILRVVFAAAGVQFWVLGLAHVPIWQAIALIMTSPFFVTLGAGLLLQERISSQRWMAVFAGFIGGMIILEPWADAFNWTALYPVAAALLWALSSLTTKYLTATEQPETLTLYLLLLLTPINAVLAVPAGFSLGSGSVLWIVAGAGLLTAAAQYVLVKAYSVADAAYLQPFDHLKLPLNVVLGWIVFGFLPGGNMWVGSTIIIVSSFYLFSREARGSET